jgi:predicted dehydrogenase
MDFPAIVKAKEITTYPEFGKPSTIIAKYPQSIPAQDEKADLKGNPQLIGFLDLLCHPMSIINHLMGRINTLYYERSTNGGGFASFKFESGAAGALHFSAGQSGTCPLERLEVIGEGANVIVENGIRLIYHRPGQRGPGGYGGSPSFIGPDEGAPMVWEPEFSLGQLYNKGVFLLGYYGEIAYFADCVRDNRKPEKAGLEDAIEVTRVYEAFMQPEGQVIEIKR